MSFPTGPNVVERTSLGINVFRTGAGMYVVILFGNGVGRDEVTEFRFGIEGILVGTSEGTDEEGEDGADDSINNVGDVGVDDNVPFSACWHVDCCVPSLRCIEIIE